METQFNLTDVSGGVKDLVQTIVASQDHPSTSQPPNVDWVYRLTGSVRNRVFSACIYSFVLIIARLINARGYIRQTTAYMSVDINDGYMTATCSPTFAHYYMSVDEVYDTIRRESVDIVDLWARWVSVRDVSVGLHICSLQSTFPFCTNRFVDDAEKASFYEGVARVLCGSPVSHEMELSLATRVPGTVRKVLMRIRIHLGSPQTTFMLGIMHPPEWSDSQP